MNRIPLLLILLLLAPPATRGQGGPKVPGGQGYVFWSAGGANTETAIQHFGGGGETYLRKGLGIGAEIGYLSPLRGVGDGIGVLSVNGLYEFGRTKTGKLRPFVTGGYSLAFRGGTAHAVNFGGGVNYWFSRRAGLRFEIRDHFPPEYANVHFWGVRVGLNLR